MASDSKSTKPILGQSRKRKRFNHLPKLNLNQKVEVQIIEDGFQGSWHIGTVTDRKNRIPVIKYDHLSDKIRANRKQSGGVRCGKIRPVPPCVKRNRNCLHYGQCVDVFHDNAWWEGVIFDYNDISEERLVFFPDIGDELMARFEDIRFSLDWNPATAKWRIRKDWIFLQVLEEFEVEWPILVSVKQIWSEVRNKKTFVDDIVLWSRPLRKKWKETVKEVLFDNFNLTMNEIYGRLNSLAAIKRCNSDVNNDADLDPPGFANVADLPVDYCVPGPNVLPQAKCCPDAISEYNEGFIPGNKHLVSTSIKVRQHLLYLGWKIECKKKYPAQTRKSLRYRYTDTNGKRFYTLSDVCKEFNNLSSKTTIVDSKKPKFKKDSRFKESDYICSICHYGGELVLCDQCPSSFHTFCLGLKEVPDGEWFCPSCCCRICTQNRYDEHCEQSTDSSILSCEQCERIYHIGCLKKTDRFSKLDTITKIKWFCSSRCEEIFTGLEKLLEKSIPVGNDNLTWTLLKYKKTEVHNRSKLNIVIKLLHECFNPVKEPLTQRDIVEDVIFCKGSELNRLNFTGFYTVLLEKENELISAGTLRVYGEKVAELPFVGTRLEYRKRGMCRILMNELEKNLEELGVERLVLPAASSVLQTWTKSFGFSVMTESEKLKFLGYTFLDFQGTKLCHKLLTNGLPSVNPSISIGNSCEPINEVDIENLDGVKAVSEVSQAEQINGIVRDDHCSPGALVSTFQGNEVADNVSGKASLEILLNGPILVECQSEKNIECSTKENEDHNDDNTLLNCLQRKKIEVCGSTFEGNAAAYKVSGIACLEILLNGPIIVECQWEKNIECSMKRNEDHNVDNALLKCYQRRNKKLVGGRVGGKRSLLSRCRSGLKMRTHQPS